MTNITWDCKSFEKLTATELYEILKLRNQIFVVEQQCVYLDTDDKDFASYHLCGWQDGLLVAYLRILPPGLSYTEPSIGRVCCNPSVRNKGMGKAFMTHGLAFCYQLYDAKNIRISAQLYLLEFYNTLGFKQVSELYLEDNIPHIEMLHIK